MYICRECKAEYKTKVEYCDCGNNTFDYIEDSNPAKTQPKPKNMTLEQKSELVSRLFFTLCLIISVIVWLIPVKSEVKQAPAQQTKPKAETTQIPDIDKIWDDTPIYRETQTQTEVINTETIPLTSAPAATDNRIAVQPRNETVKKNSPKPAQAVNTPKAPKTEQISKPGSYEIVYNPPPVSKKKEVKQQPKRIEQPKPSYNPNSPAMLKYKGDLRAALFSKFAAGSIPGSGSCEIEFAVDKTGKLINRKFSRESDNKTLNDVVYYMLMSVPKYLPPPSEYNGQTIRMKFVIENGSYEISIN